MCQCESFCRSNVVFRRTLVGRFKNQSKYCQFVVVLWGSQWHSRGLEVGWVTSTEIPQTGPGAGTEPVGAWGKAR